MRLVLDTDVVVAALRSDQGASRQLVFLALDRRYELLLSVPLILEYEAVLTRPEHLEAAEVTAEDVGAILDALAAVCRQVRLAFLWRPVLPDPNDDMVLETAINGAATALVTFNHRDFAPAMERFAVSVTSPRQALDMLRST